MSGCACCCACPVPPLETEMLLLEADRAAGARLPGHRVRPRSQRRCGEGCNARAGRTLLHFQSPLCDGGDTPARAVLQFMCSVSLRARRLFLKEKATSHRAFGAQQLENSYKSPPQSFPKCMRIECPQFGGSIQTGRRSAHLRGSRKLSKGFFAWTSPMSEKYTKTISKFAGQ